MRAITFTYHLKMKLSNESSVGEVMGDQVSAWKCYMASLSDPTSKDTLTVEVLEDKDKQMLKQGEPIKIFVKVPIDETMLNQTVRVMSFLSKTFKI
jgi:hypothetical protein